MSWIRARFYADDERPVKWPPVGPFWCSGYSLKRVHGELDVDKAVVIAYFKSEEQILEYWPDAVDIEFTHEIEVTCSDRFPKPSYWDEQNNCFKEVPNEH